MEGEQEQAVVEKEEVVKVEVEEEQLGCHLGRLCPRRVERLARRELLRRRLRLRRRAVGAKLLVVPAEQWAETEEREAKGGGGNARGAA